MQIDTFRFLDDQGRQLCIQAMDSVLKFDQENADISVKNEEKTPYRLCYRDRIKVINTRPALNEDKIINTTFHETEKPETREVLRMAKVNSVDIIQTKAIHENYAGNIPKTRSVTSMEGRTTPSLYLPYLLGNTNNATPVFNLATYKGFRTLQERKSMAFTRTLERDHKQLINGPGKSKRLLTPAVIDISRPIQLYSRYSILYPRSAR